MPDCVGPRSPQSAADVIPLEKCVDRGIYRIRSRNLIIGVFVAERSGFIGIREKCGYEYLFTEFHRDIGPPLGTVSPLAKVGSLPLDIPATEHEHHGHGSLWWKVGKKTGKWRPVNRRPLGPAEMPHGNRQGFVDVWVHDLNRLPDSEYPCVRGNERLFKLLKDLEKECATK